MKRKIIVAFAILITGLTALMIYRNYFQEATTLEGLLAKTSFAYLQPPSDFMDPGTIAIVEEGEAGILKIICPCETAFGPEVRSKYVTRNSADIVLSQESKGNFSLDLSYLNNSNFGGQNNLIKKISISLSNVKILELPDDAVFDLLTARSEGCIRAINNRLKNGQKTTMIKRVLQADTEYIVDFIDDLEETVKTSLIEDLTIELAGANSSHSSNKIVGKGLYWGVDDDSGLGSLQPGVPPSTGSSGKRRVTDSLSTYRVEYDQISYSVSGIKQPSEMSCWISVYTMMKSWKDGKNYDIKTVISELGTPWIDIFNADTGLPEAQIDDFIDATGLQTYPPANYVPSFYTDLLKEHGPIWLITGNAFSSHAKLLVGISGDNTGNEAILTFIDPKDGKLVRQKFMEFIEEYEREAIFVIDKRPDLNLRTQILHF